MTLLHVTPSFDRHHPPLCTHSRAARRLRCDSSRLIVIRRSDYEKLVKAELIAELKKKQTILHRAVPSSKVMSKVRVLPAPLGQPLRLPCTDPRRLRSRIGDVATRMDRPRFLRLTPPRVNGTHRRRWGVSATLSRR